MNALDLELPSQCSTSALDTVKLTAEVERLATTNVAAQLRAPFADAEGCRSLLESIYASIGSSPQGGAPRTLLDVELGDALDEIYKAHET